MNPIQLIKMLSEYQSENVFNPYRDVCPLHDHKDSPAIRRTNLLAFMSAVEREGCDSIWFGRDLGYRGGRRTGLALTDEARLPALSRAYGCQDVRKATATAAVSERTATEIWRMLEGIESRPFLWNAFPFHPHKPNEPMTNRCFTARELNATREMLHAILGWLKPKNVIALGNDAVRVLATLGVDAQYVRHPSYGGQADFMRGITQIFGISHPIERQLSLV